ncbi:MFS transporter [Bradyrhizobium sp. CCBAU 53351]|uniref:MFS transporter n=1 Tax=Bradyrhizobium TaxID=374 RepID=UPI00188712B6|nr:MULTISPECIES: MFS transporter [Bradyrhizobium]MCS3758618.1 putative MFS family arabinose efflux permease [Bradyrhizobium centrosematis]MCS3773494.1 putative MFS family arabinose efflux permease [Bradyrhizobium centrosematis]MDT4741811.1 MFS transporter [Bradyrhizobium sp. WYCCWR 12699]QOZ78021.1 MFS transporter [Bradyrhizobium sp. CCBAU 53351]
MEKSPAAGRFAPTALMLGNLVTGCSVLAPAGMLPELARGLDISIHAAGLLITFGAVTLCIGSPLTAWLTSRIERRTLLTTTLAVLALGNLASALAPGYTSLLVIRLVMLAVGALYTPQAAGTAAMIVPTERRGSTIAYIFLGWSLAAAVGLPLITFIASRYGWQAAYGGIGALGCLSVLLLLLRLPAGLKGVPVDLKTWREVGRDKTILLLLAITMLQMSGQFVVFTFMGPLLGKLTGAGPDAIGMVFALYGVCGFLGVVIATRIVDSWGPYRTSLLFACLLLTGIAGWAIGAGALAFMAAGVAVWGLGFASTNSMQQVRLVAAAPPLASATVALNTSVLYIGQAVGSAIGGLLFARELLHTLGFVAVGFVVLALILIVLTRPHRVAAAA